ncbi:MAG: class I SAM-dependent methyltransferase, partial [Alphaproteobacteria bacterium]|nr:class I SAM-dependent methyltransferase [Alphaproteobacteria bacterium]
QRDEADTYGDIALRHNTALDFIENAAFDAELVVYDAAYQNSQAHSPAFWAHMQDVAALLRRHFPRGSQVVEVGCGKGDFITLLEQDGYFSVTGFDNTYEGDKPNIHRRYLTETDRITADLVVLRHTLEHIPEPHLFLELLKKIFGSTPIYIEVPCFDWIRNNKAFFDITYEHVNYFSQSSLKALFTETPVDFGLLFSQQYQYIIADIAALSDDFKAHYNNSSNWQNLDFYSLFPSLKEQIESIDQSIQPPQRVFLWGAATKGCVFLLHCSFLGKILPHLAFAIDINPGKIGKFLPGSRVPIESKDAFFKAVKPDDTLIIANPNYQHEIKAEIDRRGISGIKIICL